MEGVKISDWVEEAGYHSFYGKSRFVTAWNHPGGPPFWIKKGRMYWDSYAKQMAEFVA